MKNLRDLKVWEKAYASTLDSYRFTNAFPRQELLGPASQIRRAGVSIAANVAAGSEASWSITFSWLVISIGWTECPAAD